MADAEGHAPASHRVAMLFYRNTHLLVLTLLVLVIAGASALGSLPRIEDPRITNRNPLVLTMLPGASAERVEALVTKKLEDRLREVSEIKELESTSRPGISLISLELEDWIDSRSNEAVFSKIRDKLADAERELPSGAGRPEFDDKRGAVAYSMIAAVTWRASGEPRLGVLTRLGNELADRLRNVAGTENVRLFGESVEEVTVTVDNAELAALGLSSADVSRLIAAADAKMPAGVLRAARRDVLVELEGELGSEQRIAAVPLAVNDNGSLVKLGDVATVSKQWRDPPGALGYTNGVRAVFVAARVDPNVRLDRWALQAREVIAAFGEQTHGGLSVDIAFDQTLYTESRLQALGGNLIAGAAVVMLVVFVGMGWRAALVVGAALPLSAAFTLFGLTFFGQQIHQMTIFGMIIAIGLLIDNAIVVTDEVRKQLNRGASRAQAMRAAVTHLFTPLLASTLTTILGFMPIFLLPGNIGDFVGPIAISVVLALVGSFLISMTLIAALAAHFVQASAGKGARHWWREGIGNRSVTECYRRALSTALRYPWLALGATLALPVLGFVLATTLGNQFFPSADRDQFEVEVWLPNESSLARSEETARAIEAVIRREPAVRGVDWLVGGSFPSVYYNLIMDQDNEASYAHAVVLGENVAAVNAMIPRLQRVLTRTFPDAQIVVSPFGQGPPYEAPVAFRIVGPSLDTLRESGEQLRRIMHRQPSILHTRATIAGGEPKLWFNVDERQARLAGLTLADIAVQLQTSLEGQTGGSVLEALEELPVRIRVDNSQRASLAELRMLNLVSPVVSDTGQWIPAEALGGFELRPELSSVTRRNGERVNKVLGYIDADTLPIEVTRAVLADAEAQGFELPPGYRLEVAGNSEEQGRAIALLATYVPVLVALMIATVVLSFRSVTMAAIIMSVAAMSAGLGMLSLWLAGFPLGFNPLLGTAGLVGVAINGTIVVLAAIRANPAAHAGDDAAIVQETLGATRHILSTTLTTMAGFVPLLLFTGGSFWPPLAVVIAGGVGFSVTLALLFTPTVYCLLHRGRRGAEAHVAQRTYA